MSNPTVPVLTPEQIAGARDMIARRNARVAAKNRTAARKAAVASDPAGDHWRTGFDAFVASQVAK